MDDDILCHKYLEIIYIYIDWSVHSAQYTTETGLPLFKNTDLEFVINLNIDKPKLRF